MSSRKVDNFVRKCISIFAHKWIIHCLGEETIDDWRRTNEDLVTWINPDECSWTFHVFLTTTSFLSGMKDRIDSKGEHEKEQTLSNVRFGWDTPRILLKRNPITTQHERRTFLLPIRRWTANRIIDICHKFQWSFQILANNWYRSCTRSQPNQSKIIFSLLPSRKKTLQPYPAKVRSSSPTFSLSLAICRKRANNLNNFQSFTSAIRWKSCFTWYRIEWHIPRDVLRQNHCRNRLNYS